RGGGQRVAAGGAGAAARGAAYQPGFPPGVRPAAADGRSAGPRRCPGRPGAADRSPASAAFTAGSGAGLARARQSPLTASFARELYTTATSSGRRLKLGLLLPSNPNQIIP